MQFFEYLNNRNLTFKQELTAIVAFVVLSIIASIISLIIGEPNIKYIFEEGRMYDSREFIDFF